MKIPKNFLMITLIILLVSESIFLGFFIGSNNNSKMLSYIDNEINKKGISYKDETNCSSEDLLFSSYCLRKELNVFYNYNLTNKLEPLSLEELKSLGGVCSHFSIWYNDNIKKLGFYSKTISIDTNTYSFKNDSGHEITLAWDEEFNHICILDQSEVACT